MKPDLDSPRTRTQAALTELGGWITVCLCIAAIVYFGAHLLYMLAK